MTDRKKRSVSKRLDKLNNDHLSLTTMTLEHRAMIDAMLTMMPSENVVEIERLAGVNLKKMLKIDS